MLKHLHALVYAGMSASYVGTCIGADKVWISALLAALYFALAVHDFMAGPDKKH